VICRGFRQRPNDARQLRVISRARARSEPQELGEAKVLDPPNLASAQMLLETWHRAEASPDVHVWAALLIQPNDELLNVGSKQL
jgi:hypothetical protein